MSPVKNVIIGVSYNLQDSAQVSDRNVMKYAEEYKKRHNREVHKLERFINGKDNLKFLYPLSGVPMVCFGMINAMHSQAERVCVVGSRDVENVVSIFSEVFHEQEGRFVFSHEGKELSLANTLRRGYEALAEEGPVLWVPGDIPFFTGLDGMLGDKDAFGHSVVMDFNAEENIFPENNGMARKFNKTFHHTLLNYQGRDLRIKEPNPMIFNLGMIGDIGRWPVFNSFYGSRKSGGVGIKTLLSSSLSLGLYQTMRVALLSAQKLPEFYKGRIDSPTAEEIANLIMPGTKLKAEHKDLSRLIDIDSFEDHYAYEAWLALGEGKISLYPYLQDVERLRKAIKPTGFGISPHYVDYRRRKLGMKDIYDVSGRVILDGNLDDVKACCDYISARAGN